MRQNTFLISWWNFPWNKQQLLLVCCLVAMHGAEEREHLHLLYSWVFQLLEEDKASLLWVTQAHSLVDLTLNVRLSSPLTALVALRWITYILSLF